MAEMAANEPTTAALSAERVRGLLRERGIDSLSCPACQADAWGRYFDAAVSIIKGRDPVSGKASGASRYVHTVGMTCGECGYMCFFDREVLGG